MTLKKYRFFMHYNKPNKCMTVHYKGQCYLAKHIICEPECQTHYKSTQPHLVLRGWCSNLIESKSLNQILIRE